MMAMLPPVAGQAILMRNTVSALTGSAMST
jgi:hypothetical protein